MPGQLNSTMHRHIEYRVPVGLLETRKVQLGVLEGSNFVCCIAQICIH